VCACREAEEELPPPSKSLPTQVIDNFTLTETDAENVAWRLKADRADVYDYAHEARVFDVHVDFYEEGVYSSTLTAREGTVDLLQHSMTARGDVVLVSRKDGAVLKTEELSWDADGHRIYSESYATLERGRSVIRGRGFTATPGLESFSTHELDADFREEEMKGLEDRRKEKGGGEKREGE
jgi:LPS export ABC transporter protein LptC